MVSASSSDATVTDLTPDAFMARSQSLRLLDVRSELEYRMFHAPTAVNLSLQRLLLFQVPLLRRWALPRWFQDLPKEDPIAVICLTAHRSPIAAQLLVKMGFRQVFNITGGMQAWRNAGLPIQQGK